MTDKIDDIIRWESIPALAGYTVWFLDDDGELCSPEPVIAWLIQQRRCKDRERCFWSGQPVTAATADVDNQDYVIQYPDGRVEFPEERIVESLEEARKHAKEKKEKKPEKERAG
jgi:hypothetical protein